MPRPALIIRLTHTGQFADGRANTNPVLVNDLDVGYEQQDRKVAVYVPPGGSIDINASSRSMLSFEQGVIKKFTQANVLQSRMFYVPESYSTVTRPSATLYPAGTYIWNTTDNNFNFSDGTNWVYGAPATPSGAAGGDLGGFYPNPIVDGFQNRPVAATAPNTGDVYIWNGSQWVPGSPTSGVGTMGYALHPIQAITAVTDQLTPVGTYHRFTSAGNITLTSTPQVTWPGAVAGQLLVLHNVGTPGAGHLTVSRGVPEAMALSNANKRIDEGGTMTLIYDGSVWIEISHVQATSL